MIEIKGKDETGAEGQWMVELGGSAELGRNGWNRNQFKTGDQVSVDGWMARDGSKKLSAKSVKPSSGRELFAASSFFSRNRGEEPAATTGREPAPKPQR
jgi:uncharacterized protein DUF6152